MRHRHGMRKLNRTTAHRLAMLRNMANSLLLHEAIKTTVPKAKELRRVVEPLITLSKTATVANRRLAFNRLRDRDMVVKLFDEIGPMFKDRNGGYTRILKMGYRVGDNAPMAYMELVQKTTDTDANKAKKQVKKPVLKPAKPAPAPAPEAKPAAPAPEPKPEAKPETSTPEPKPAETKAEEPAKPAETTPAEAKPEEQPNPAESVPTEKVQDEQKPAE